MKTPTPSAVSIALRQLLQARQPAAALYPEVAMLIADMVPHDEVAVLSFDDAGEVSDTYWPQRYPFPWVLAEGGRRLFMQLQHGRADVQRVPFAAVAQACPEAKRVPASHWLALCVRDDAQLRGVLLLARHAERWPFAERDLRRLSDLMPMLAQVLTVAADGKASDEAMYPAETAFAVADHRAAVLYGSPDVWGMLHHAAGLAIRAADHGGVSPDRLRVFIDRLQHRHAEGAGAVVRMHEVRNRYGCHVCRVHEVAAPGHDGERHAVIQIERRVSLIQHLFRSERFRALTARERDVCALLLDDKTYGEIASALGIRQNSVVFHVRNLYGALGVDQRSQIWAALQDAPPIARIVRTEAAAAPRPVMQRAYRPHREHATPSIASL